MREPARRADAARTTPDPPIWLSVLVGAALGLGLLVLMVLLLLAVRIGDYLRALVL